MDFPFQPTPWMYLVRALYWVLVPLVALAGVVLAVVVLCALAGVLTEVILKLYEKASGGRKP